MKHDHAAGGNIQRLFAIDVRSLALFRICIGLVLLVDILSRSTDIQQHYSDLGVLPREALWQLLLLSKWHWSLHAWTCSVAGQTVLFACAAACAVALILGYRTLACLLSVPSVRFFNERFLPGRDRPGVESATPRSPDHEA